MLHFSYFEKEFFLARGSFLTEMESFVLTNNRKASTSRCISGNNFRTDAGIKVKMQEKLKVRILSKETGSL